MRISDWSSDVCSSDLQVVDLDAGPAVRSDPGPGRDVGDAELVHEVFAILQPFVEDGIEAPGLRLIAVGDGRKLLGKIAEKHAGLALHRRSEEHTSELQSLMRISYDVLCLKKKKY